MRERVRRRLPRLPVVAADVVAAVGLAVAAYRGQAARFAGAQYIDLGSGGDWIAHAYRSQLAAVNQLTSWDPAWDRGYPNLDGWQEGPDWLTGMVSRLLHQPVPRTMLVLTILCLVVYPVAGYVALRLMRCGPLAALVGAGLLLDSPALFTVVEDYSGLFALVALPVAAWLILNQFGRRGGWAAAIFVGLLVELHPFAAVAAVCVVITRVAYDRGADLRRIAAQCAVALAVGAPYWLTFLTFARPRAADTGYEASVGFARSHFIAHVGIGELPLAVIPLAGGVLLAAAARRLPHARQTACCLGAAALMGAALLLSYLGWLPGFVMAAQLTRSMPFVLVLVAMGLAPLGDMLPAIAARLLRRRRQMAVIAAAAVATVATVLLSVDGARAASRYSAPVASDAYPTGHDIAAWLARHPDIGRPAVFWADPDVAAAASYDAFAQVEFTSDYSARGWSVANTAITTLLSAHAPYAKVEPYLRAEGVSYLYAANRRLEATTIDAWLADGSVTLVDRGVAGRIVAVPAPTPAAFSASATVVRAAVVPDLAFYTDPVAATHLDGDMRRWASVGTTAQASAATTMVTSPSVRRITVRGRRGDVLVVGQRWDAAWTASVDGRPLMTERVGPDLLGVDVDTDGPQTIVVRHQASTGELASLLLLGLGVLGALAVTVAGGRRSPGHERR